MASCLRRRRHFVPNPVQGDYCHRTGARRRRPLSIHAGYDAEGNCTAKFIDVNHTGVLQSGDTNVTQYVWDAGGRLVQVTQSETFGTPTQIVTYLYDAEGRWIARKVAVYGSLLSFITTQRFAYDGTNPVLAFDGDNNLTDRYLWGPAVDQVLADENYNPASSTTPSTAGTTKWTLGDNQNTVRDVVADDGTLLQHIAYSRFGQQLVLNNGAYVAQVAFAFGYTGEYTDTVTGDQLHGVRWYDPQSQRWLTQDPLGLGPDSNPYRYCGNGPGNGTDPSGMNDYKEGTNDPKIGADPGAGAWDSTPWTWSMLALKVFIQDRLIYVWAGLPDASNYLQHYLDNSGTDYTIRLQQMIYDVPSAKRLYEKEIAKAQKFVETLPEGEHQVTSGSASGGYNTKDESWNWYYAVGGYSAWCKGKAKVCKDAYTLEFEYKFADRYNWDKGKSVNILGVTVTDEFMGEFHREGLAKEFDMNDSVKKTSKWKKGKAAKITDGWDTGGGREGR